MTRESAYSESALLEQVAVGSEAAFTELFHRYKYKLFGFMYKLTDSAEMAEDVVQEVFMKLWKNRSGLGEVENISSYMFRMAQNQAINSFKRMAKETLILDELKRDIHPMVNVEDMLAAREAEETLKKAISKLPQQQKLVYHLSREQGLKYEEIAGQLNISPGTVKNHMIQALKTIRAHFAQHPGNPILVLFFLSIASAFEK